jgi:hypothetical protein
VPNQTIWWERFWGQAMILIEAQDEDVDSFVGSRMSSTVQEHLDRNVDHVNEYTARRIAAGLQRWTEAQDSVEAANALRDYLRYHLPAVDMTYSTAVTCPACGQGGTIKGEQVASSDVEVDPETGDAWETVEVYPEVFECGHCGLVLDGVPYLEVGGLDDTFTQERDYQPIWDDYGND